MASQPTVPSYSRPPVREAIIDIQIDALPEELLPKLKECGTAFESLYPKTKTHYRGTISMKVSDGDVTSEQNRQLFGYSFHSLDENRCVQLRSDGFTFNLLKPDPMAQWPGWQVLREEAHGAWDKYVIATKPVEIKRLAVRYINQIVIPEGKIELLDYFTEPPRVPDGLPQSLNHYFSRIVVNNPDPNAFIIITQAPAPQKYQNQPTFTLDIDVIREQRMPLDSFDLWSTLDSFRELKNTVFEASLHPKAKDLFGPEEKVE
ncbi:MAG: TIGR04255 family protein [Nitrospira sp. SB0666_bin_27]|nr:TIGR04255 family protein [Nitrospira sp. SB0666_bin_27]MYF25704.1 TIGR04255 family protein [Nitrospira sp. SB0678_bin_10]